MEENEHPFVEEHIVPSKRKLQQEFLKSVGRMFLYGAVFGAAAGMFFVLTENLLNDRKQTSYAQSEKETEKDVVKTSDAEETEKDKGKTKKEKDISTEVVEAGETYQKKIREWNQSIVSISSGSENSGFFENTKTFGVAIEENKKNLFFLSSYSSLSSDLSHLQVTFSDGTVCSAKLAGKDADADIVIISIEMENLPESTKENIKIMKTSGMGQFQMGNDIVFLGCPNGSVYSVNVGIISGQAERNYITDYCIDLYSTNMIKDENGSGIIVSMDGKLMGMANSVLGNIHNNTVVFSGISNLKKIIDRIINKKDILFCGIKAEDIPQQQRAKMGITNGIYVMEIEPNSPADQAGIRTGDIIREVEGTDITSVVDFYAEISQYDVKQRIKIQAVRRIGRMKQDVSYNVTLEKKE